MSPKEVLGYLPAICLPAICLPAIYLLAANGFDR